MPSHYKMNARKLDLVQKIKELKERVKTELLVVISMVFRFQWYLMIVKSWIMWMIW